MRDKVIEKGLQMVCNQRTTLPHIEGKDNQLERLNKGLQKCEPIATTTREKIAYKLGVKYELIFSTSNG
jgi:hypothetical protein